MNQFPFVSVLMTAYNRELYIAEAIESVLASAYINFELIIVDDVSSDNTLTIIEEYACKDKRIKFFKNEKNLGDYQNRNKAASYATGEILMTVDSDDMLYPDSMDKCVSLINKYPQTRFAINNDFFSEPVLLDSFEVIKHHFFKNPLLMKGPGGTIIKRNYFNEIGGYPEKYGPANDMYFNLKAAAKTNVILIPFEFIFYRRHEGQEINNSDSYLYNRYKYLRDALHDLNLHLTKEEISWLQKKNKRRFAVNVSKYFFKTLNFSKTIASIKAAEFTFTDFLEGVFHK